MKVAALQVTPVHYLFKPDRAGEVDHFRRMADETGMPIIIYNVCPGRICPPALLTRIMNEVPLVSAAKKSGGDLTVRRSHDDGWDKLIYQRPSIALMYPSYTLAPTARIAAICPPRPCVGELWDAVKAAITARRWSCTKMLTLLWNAIIADNLPAAPLSQTLQGLPKTFSRAPMRGVPAQQAAIRTALEGWARGRQRVEAAE